MAPVPKPKRERTKHFLKEWREYRELTQEQAIGRLGWSQSKISRVEAGLTPYNQDDLEAAAVAYSCDAWQLISVNPLKDGEVIDLIKMIDDNNRKRAIKIISALKEADG